jgi:hypothetical protein
MPLPATFFGLIVFGVIGFSALMYGRKLVLPRPMILGVALMVYPYFLSNIWLLYGIGILLTVALFYPKD